MKLRNKKTGKIIEYSISLNQWSEDEQEWYLFGNYDSIDELKEEWEDYKPAEPLIKDKKIRKAVKAWSKAEKLKKVFIFNLNVLGKNLIMITEGNNGGRKITFKGRLKIAEGFYTVIELCGEEQE